MSETPAPDPAPAPAARPGWLRPLMALPLLVSTGALIAALVLAFRVDAPRVASGERLTLHFASDCPAESAAVLRSRIDQIGLGDPEVRTGDGEVTVTATLPGLPDDREAIPALLSRPGHLSLVIGGQEVASEADLAGTPALNVDTRGMPYATLRFQPAAAGRAEQALNAGGPLLLHLDEELLLSQDPGRPLDKDRLPVQPDAGTPQERMRAAADWAIVLGSGPHRCPLRLRSVDSTGGPG